MKASTARRKGLTIRMSRRMKHVYPRAIRLVQQRAVDVNAIVTHRFSLSRAADAFAGNAAYQDGIIKGVDRIVSRRVHDRWVRVRSVVGTSPVGVIEVRARDLGADGDESVAAASASACARGSK